MDKAGTITMTMHALDRMKVIQALVDGNLRPKLAAERLGLTVRQVRRLATRYREEGPSGLVSRRCNRPSNNHKAADITGLALSVIRERYADDRIMYLLSDTPINRARIGKYVEVYEYPDGRIEPRANGAALAHTIDDRLSVIDQGAVVENKRLGHVLQIAHLVQQQRDNRRILGAPATTNQGRSTMQKKMTVGKKSQRALDAGDLAIAIAETSLSHATGFGKR